MKCKVEESYRIMRSGYLNRKYSKSKSLNLNCEAKNIFKRHVSLEHDFCWPQVWKSSFLTTTLAYVTSAEPLDVCEMFRCYCLNNRTDEITSLHQNYQCHGSVEADNSTTTSNFKF
jgi:hypothetical protein